MHFERVQQTEKEAGGVPGREKVCTKPLRPGLAWSPGGMGRSSTEQGQWVRGRHGGGQRDVRWEEGFWLGSAGPCRSGYMEPGLDILASGEARQRPSKVGLK